ncbi:MAG TPA: hypothetical protein VJK54_01020 [Chthoniobacterales bacterium]|nr:hypothetical protein [Chthoniobacterales bacterium]
MESLPQTHSIKIEIAALLRFQTTLSTKWITHELTAWAPSALAVALYRNKKTTIPMVKFRISIHVMNWHLL